MNIRQTTTNKMCIPFSRRFAMTQSASNNGEGISPKNSKEMDERTLQAKAKGVTVLIVSGNSFVTDFLRGLVAVHGYETEVVSDFHEAYVRVRGGLAHVVFIDDACFGIKNFKNFQQRAQKLIQEGIPVILLTDEPTKQHLQQISTIKFFGIVRKPVGYLQIGQVLADLIPG